MKEYFKDYEVLITETSDVINVYLRKDNDLAGSSEVSIIDNNLGYYSRLYVKDKYRKQGLARFLYNKTCSLMDKHHIDLMIDINPYGDVSFEDLEKFYISNGAEIKEGHLFRKWILME